MGQVAIAVKTKDRHPHRNYLGQTLTNMQRAGVFESKLLHSVTLVTNSGIALRREYVEEIPRALRRRTTLAFGGPTLHANAAAAIRMAASTCAPWAMVLEDDLDFCADFLEGAVAWLRKHARADRCMYVFGANFAQIKTAFTMGEQEWAYPVGAFYGAQALAWTGEDAHQLAEWLGEDPYYGNGIRDHGHDLLLQKWGRDRGLKCFSASVPSFVQHIGEESGIGNRFFHFGSWQGRAWRYGGQP